MLDDLQKIHERDRDDTLGMVAESWRQLEVELSFTFTYESNTIRNVVFSGMGGSAAAALLAPIWPTVRVPFEVVRGYELPAYVGPESLCIAGSYSGTTEETIEALTSAEERGAHVVVIAAGGALIEHAKKKNYPYIVIPAIRQPRFATFYNLKALVTVLSAAGLCSIDAGELHAASEFLRTTSSCWLPTIATKSNYAKQIAQECMGKSIVIYAGPKLGPAAYKWKIDFNENAKQVSWWNVLPEFSHNEFSGWSKQPIDKPYEVIELRSKLEHPRIQRRFEETERLLSGLRPAPLVVQVEGGTLLEQLVWSITLGDFVSIYLGMLNGLDPAPLPLVDKLKQALKA